MRRLIAAIERRATRACNRLANICYYLGRGHTLRQSIRLARDTL